MASKSPLTVVDFAPLIRISPALSPVGHLTGAFRFAHTVILKAR